MIDSSEKHNRQLAFELQNSHVCEKHSNKYIYSCSCCVMQIGSTQDLFNFAFPCNYKIPFDFVLSLKPGDNNKEMEYISVTPLIQSISLPSFHSQNFMGHPPLSFLRFCNNEMISFSTPRQNSTLEIIHTNLNCHIKTMRYTELQITLAHQTVHSPLFFR